jgi:hypothetical protein
MGKISQMIIRQMEADEMDLIVNLFEYYKDEALIEDDEWQINRVVQTIKNYSVSWNLFFRIAYEGQRPVGVIGGFVSEDPITGERVAAIQFNYLKPDYASVGNYRQLVDTFLSWTEEVKATDIKCMDIGNNLTRLDDVYENLGFRHQTISIYGKEIA